MKTLILGLLALSAIQLNAQTLTSARTWRPDPVVKRSVEVPTVSDAHVSSTVKSDLVDDTGGGSQVSSVAAELSAFSAPYSFNGVPVKNNSYFEVIQKDQVLAIKVDFSQRDWVSIENVAYQLLVFQNVRSVDLVGGQYVNQNLNAAFQNALTAAIISGGGHRSQAYYRAYENHPRTFRSFKENRVTVSLSRVAGDMSGADLGDCAYGGLSKSMFTLSDDASTQVPVARNCNRILKNADGSVNKIWYINIKLNHCDYSDLIETTTFRRDANGLIIPSSKSNSYETVEGSEAACDAKIEVVRDELFYNRGVFQIGN